MRNIPIGLLQFTDGVDGKTLTAHTRRVEQLGYDILWIPELAGRDPVATSGFLLAHTERLRIGTGILNVYARDAHAAAQTRHTLAELSGGRFVLGLGVSHPVLVEPRGHAFSPPATKMRQYVEALCAVPVEGPGPVHPAPIVIAGHGPKLMQVASDLAAGLFVYLQSPAAVRRARALLGPNKEIHAVVRTVLIPDREKALAVARKALGFYLQLPPYQRAWALDGFDASDLAGEGSDRLIDMLAPSGDADALRMAVQTYIDAGASHISLCPILPGTGIEAMAWDWATIEALAPTQR